MKDCLNHIAVLTVSYNHEQWIGQCIESVLQQQCSMPIVHYIWDDNSTDGTYDAIKFYQRSHPERIISFRQQSNKGAAHNYLDALEAILSDSRNKYLALLDGDDYWIDETHLEVKSSYMNEYEDCGITHSNISILQRNGTLSEVHKRIENTPQGDIFNIMLMQPLFSALTVMIRADLLRDLPIAELRALPLQTIDHALELWVCSKSKVKYFETNIGVWRRHGNTISTSQNLSRSLAWIEHECAQHKWIVKHFPDCVLANVDLDYHRANQLFNAYFVAGKYDEAMKILKDNSRAGEYRPRYEKIIRKGRLIYYLYILQRRVRNSFILRI